MEYQLRILSRLCEVFREQKYLHLTIFIIKIFLNT